MADPKITELLADLVKANAARGPLPTAPQVAGLSNAILSSVGIPKARSSANNPYKDPRGPSVVNRVLDIMSRPLYTALTPLKHELEGDQGKSPTEIATHALNPLNMFERIPQAWAGLSGKEKTTGRDIIKAAGGEDLPGPLKAGLGFGIDVAADPTTYLGFGLVPKLGKAAKGSTEALRAVEEGTGKTSQSLSEELSKIATKQSVDVDKLPVAEPDELEGILDGATSLKPKNKKLLDTFMEEQAATARASTPEAKRAKLLEDFADEKASSAASKATKDFYSGQFVRHRGPAGEIPAGESNFLRRVRDLNEGLAKATDESSKDMFRRQIEHLTRGLTPEDVLGSTRRMPLDFPPITIGSKYRDIAMKVGDDFLKSNKLKEINHVGQSALYNRISNAARKIPKKGRPAHMLQMLRIAEDQILAAGRKLTDNTGVSVRLSDLANTEGGPNFLTARLVDDFRGHKPSALIENIKAATTPKVVEEILDPVIKTGSELAEATAGFPGTRKAVIASDLSKELSKIAENAGASSKEASTARAFIHDLFNPERDPLYSTIEQQARSLVRTSATGIIDPKTLSTISEKVYQALGANPKVLGRQLEQGKVVEGIMTKFATWWGAKDLKPFSREYIDTARNVAAAFSETMKPIVKNTTRTTRKNAFAVAQGKMSAGSPQEQALATQFKFLVEKLLGTHGVTSSSEAVLLRSGTVMKELNDEMPKTLKFVDGVGTDKLGRHYDYSKGQWMHSWEQWDVDEPAEALYQLTRTLQMVTRKNAMWDDAAIRWGLPTKGAEYQHTVGNVPRLAGTYFPKEIATQITNLKNQLDRDIFRTPNKAIGLFDKVQRMWKTGVTIYSPSHHIRNLNGDIYLAALDGVVSVRPYTIATKVLHAFPTRYKSIENVFNIMDPGLRERALRARPGNIVLTTRGGEKLTSAQIYEAAESQGLFVRAMHAEDLIGEGAPSSGTFGLGFRPLGGKVYDTATRASELRDHWVRLAHFIDVLGKSKQPLRVAIEQAGRRVRKFHPDGMDLTGFEQNVLRRVIPFYSWLRKATPLVLEGAVMRPHVTLAFPKAMANLQLATGIESEGPGDPFPVDQMFPDWIKEKGIGPILQPGSGLGRDETWRGKAPGYTIVNPTSPFIDQVSQLGSPEKTLLSSLTPAVRLPMELLTGQTSLGIPLENVEGGVPGHIAQQVPAVGIGMRLSGATRDNEPYNPEQLINYLTGAGVTGTGPYQAQSQVEIRQLLQQLAARNRGDYR